MILAILLAVFFVGICFVPKEWHESGWFFLIVFVYIAMAIVAYFYAPFLLEGG